MRDKSKRHLETSIIHQTLQKSLKPERIVHILASKISYLNVINTFILVYEQYYCFRKIKNPPFIQFKRPP